MSLLRQTLALSAALALVTSGCSLGSDATLLPPDYGVDVTIEPGDRIAIGDSARLVVASRVSPADPRRGLRFSVASSSPNVVTIDSAGRILATGVGSAILSTVRVSDGHTVNQLAVTVIPTVRITPADFTLSTRGTQTLTAALMGVPASADQRVVWSSADTTIATVSAAGTVTGQRIGITRIVARSVADATVSGSAQVTVTENPVMSISVTPASVSLPAGATAQLTTTLRVASGLSTAVSYASSDPSVATVSASGLVTALRAGTANIVVASSAEPSLTTTSRVAVVAASASQW